MDYVNLGNTGLKVSRLCLGTMSYGDPSKGWNPWILPPDDALPFVQQALDLGINFFDGADVYAEGSSEEFLGEALSTLARREEVVIATKVGGRVGASSTKDVRKGWPTTFGLSRKHILDAVDASLRRLKTDYIDLYQIHSDDVSMPIEEIIEAMDTLVRSGKVRYIGASNITAWRLAKALFRADAHHLTRFVSVQHHYNLLYREDEHELLPLLRDQNVASMPWSPLARGYLCGGRTRESAGSARSAGDAIAAQLYGSDTDFAIIDRVKARASERNATPSQLALAWLLSRPGTTIPVIGATRPQHLAEAVEAISITLDEDDTSNLEELYRPRQIVRPA